jgi:O-methyltransferase
VYEWTTIQADIIRQVRPYSMVPDAGLRKTIDLAIAAIEDDRAGDLVECGTWKGGSTFAMLLAQRQRFGKILKPVWMFDSFQGLSPADERDGPMALEYEANAFAPGNHDNCIAPLDGIRAAIASFGFTDEDIRIVPGWFNDTIPSQISDLATEGIALLRVDCDWYEPVHRVLVHLAPLVNEECPIILDDYYAWDGCARATHDYLSQNDLSWRIRTVGHFDGAWMIKRKHRNGEV